MTTHGNTADNLEQEAFSPVKDAPKFEEIDFGFLASRYEDHIKKRLREYEDVDARRVQNPFRKKELKEEFGRNIYVLRQQAKTLGFRSHGFGRGLMAFGAATLVAGAVPLFLIAKAPIVLLALAGIGATLYYMGKMSPEAKANNHILRAVKETYGLDHGQEKAENLRDAETQFRNDEKNHTWITGIYDYYAMRSDSTRQASVALGVFVSMLLSAASPIPFIPFELFIGAVCLGSGFMIEKENTKNTINETFRRVFNVTDPQPNQPG